MKVSSISTSMIVMAPRSLIPEAGAFYVMDRGYM